MKGGGVMVIWVGAVITASSTIVDIISLDFLQKACNFGIVGKKLLNKLMIIAKIGPPPPKHNVDHYVKLWK